MKNEGMTKALYRQFLFSDEWQRIRKAKLMSSGVKCNLCRFPDWKNDVHHIFYDGENKLEDLMVLCSLCHTEWHKRWPEHAKTRDEALERKTEFLQWKRRPRKFKAYISEGELLELERRLKKIPRCKNSC